MRDYSKTFNGKDKFELVKYLRYLNFSYTSISKITDLPRSTIANWINGSIPMLMKFNIDSNPVVNPSKEFAYVFGVIMGDGYLSIKKGNARMGLKVKDPDFAINFKNNLEILTNKKVKYEVYQNFHKVTLNSREWCDKIENYRTTEFLSLSYDLKIAFISGLFD